MPELRDFLDRFRPAGAPGAAARAGVPAEPDHGLAAEVTPVLALLTETHQECERIRAQAQQDAARIMSAARARAVAITADADQRASAARDEAERGAVATARARADQVVAGARSRAARIGELAAARTPALANDAIDLIRRLGAP